MPKLRHRLGGPVAVTIRQPPLRLAPALVLAVPLLSYLGDLALERSNTVCDTSVYLCSYLLLSYCKVSHLECMSHTKSRVVIWFTAITKARHTPTFFCDAHLMAHLFAPLF